MNTKYSNSKKAQLKEIPCGSLTIIGTPIGNIMDLSPRAINKFEEAVQDYQKAIRINPKWGKPYSNLALIFLIQKKYMVIHLIQQNYNYLQKK